MRVGREDETWKGREGKREKRSEWYGMAVVIEKSLSWVSICNCIRLRNVHRATLRQLKEI